MLKKQAIKSNEVWLGDSTSTTSTHTRRCCSARTEHRSDRIERKEIFGGKI